jgi:uncharacterized protein DUF5681
MNDIGDDGSLGWREPNKKPERDPRGRIKKGSSGNPKGRPPKEVRGFGHRQLARDIIAESERLITVNGEQMTAQKLFIRQVHADAIKGDKSSRELLVKLQEMAFSELLKQNKTDQEKLEALEFFMKERGPGINNEIMKMVYDARNKSKKL